MYVHTNPLVYTVHTYKPTYTYVHTYTYVRTFIHPCIHTFIHPYIIYTYVCAYTHIHIRTYVHTYCRYSALDQQAQGRRSRWSTSSSGECRISTCPTLSHFLLVQVPTRHRTSLMPSLTRGEWTTCVEGG